MLHPRGSLTRHGVRAGGHDREADADEGEDGGAGHFSCVEEEFFLFEGKEKKEVRRRKKRGALSRFTNLWSVPRFFLSAARVARWPFFGSQFRRGRRGMSLISQLSRKERGLEEARVASGVRVARALAAGQRRRRSRQQFGAAADNLFRNPAAG